MERSIVHMDLDSFFVSVERLVNSKLIGKPVIIGGTSDRGVVASCSYEARKFGVSSAMPSKLARRLCPDAIWVRGDMELYSKYSTDVTKIIAEKAPLFEKASIDEHYIDMTGMEKNFGCFKWTHELKQSITKNTGLPISFGLSVNKCVSKIATDQSKPNGELQVVQLMVKEFLTPLPIEKIPMVGQKTAQKLRNMGIYKIQTLSEMPVELMEKVLGEHGHTIWERANGIDNTPVIPYSERKSISTETTFDKDTTDFNQINIIITRMVEELVFQLRKQQKLTGCITVKIRYSNFDTHTQQISIPYTSYDHVVLKHAKELFKKVYERRLLIRLVGVKLTRLISGNQQINLFEDSLELIHLYQAMDKIRKRFGDKAVFRAITL